MNTTKLAIAEDARNRMYTAQRAYDALWLSAYNASLENLPGNYAAADLAGQARVAGTPEQQAYYAASVDFRARMNEACV